MKSYWRSAFDMAIHYDHVGRFLSIPSNIFRPPGDKQNWMTRRDAVECARAHIVLLDYCNRMALNYRHATPRMLRMYLTMHKDFAHGITRMCLMRAQWSFLSSIIDDPPPPPFDLCAFLTKMRHIAYYEIPSSTHHTLILRALNPYAKLVVEHNPHLLRKLLDELIDEQRDIGSM